MINFPKYIFLALRIFVIVIFSYNLFWLLIGNLSYFVRMRGIDSKILLASLVLALLAYWLFKRNFWNTYKEKIIGALVVILILSIPMIFGLYIYPMLMVYVYEWENEHCVERELKPSESSHMQPLDCEGELILRSIGDSPNETTRLYERGSRGAGFPYTLIN